MIPPTHLALDTRIRLAFCWFLFFAVDFWSEVVEVTRHLYWRIREGL